MSEQPSGQTVDVLGLPSRQGPILGPAKKIILGDMLYRIDGAQDGFR